MKIKKHDFVELEYAAKAKELDLIFDVTDKKLGEKLNIPASGPAKICIGEGHILKGLDQKLVGKEIDKQYTLILTPEEAFGKKDAKLIKLVPKSVFNKQQIQPFPGMQVNIDGLLATIKTVSGGRILVDFNHPLSGKTIEYKIKATKKITKTEEKIKIILHNMLRIKNPKIELKESKLEIKEKVPEQVQKTVTKKIKELIPSIKVVSYNKASKTTSRA